MVQVLPQMMLVVLLHPHDTHHNIQPIRTAAGSSGLENHVSILSIYEQCTKSNFRLKKHIFFLFFFLSDFCLFVLPWAVNHVTLSFTDFELEMVSSNCSHDAVEVLDGDNYQAPSIGIIHNE